MARERRERKELEWANDGREDKAMSLLSRIEDNEAKGGRGRGKITGIEGLRARLAKRLREEEARLERMSREEELATTWASALSDIARNERLEGLGDYA